MPITKTAVLAVACAALITAGCGGGGHPATTTVTAHIEISDSGCLLGGGDEVTVISPAGAVIGSGALGQVHNGGGLVPTYTLRLSLPAEARYGVQVTGSNAPAYWLTRAQLVKGARIVCSTG